MAMQVTMDVGCVYVVVPVGQRHPVLKVGKTGLVVKTRLRPGTTYAPKGLRVVRVEKFFNKGLAEANIHAKLAACQCKKEVCGDATEIFIADLAVIDRILAEERVTQQALSKQAFDGFKELEAAQFWSEAPSGLLGEVLDANIHRGISLKHAIIRVINSSSYEGALEAVLLKAGLKFDDRTTKAVLVDPLRLLTKLKIKDASRGFLKALSDLSHFNSLGDPIFH